jgi:ribosomal protein S18 acetylase RimI-like enzyme
MAKLAGAWVGSVRLTPSRDGYRIDDLYVRIRYRGMGVGSKLLALAAAVASADGPTVLRMWVQSANTVGLELLTKARFRQTADGDGNVIYLRRDLQG